MSRRRTPLFDSGLRPGAFPRRPSGSPSRHGYYGSGSDSGTWSSPSGSALGILSGCGLEPARLAFLAQLPESKLTEESPPPPPHLVRHRKSNTEALQPPRVSSSRLPSSPKSPVGRRHRDPALTPGRMQPTPLPAERVHDGPDRWHALTSARRDPPSPATRNFAAASVSSLLPQADRPSAPRAEGRWGSGSERGRPEASSGQLAGATTPSEREARDFHGAEPHTYPTSCSLCNACVMSAENWTTHVNSSRHADGQLGLLQRFPTWDCRMETLDRADRQSQRGTAKDGGALRQTDESRRSRRTASSERKLAQRGKVACVKFAAGSVDEAHLRGLAEPFGTVTGILVFPSLAFVELESAEQAQELVEFHKWRPATVSGRRLDFSISNTFNFVKRSCVVSFTPPPQSDDDKSDLLAVVKRFGAPVYTLFRRSKACVEMKSPEEAEKLVRYYSRGDLRLNGKVLRVSFAAETSTLRTAASAQRCREESTERTASREEDRVPEESKGERRAQGNEGGAGASDRKSQTGSPSGDRRSPEETRRSGAKTADAEKPETTASGGEQERSDVDADSERDGSDIEGMAVLGEDLEDDHPETEEEAEEPPPKGDEGQVEGDSPEPAGPALPGADGGECDEGRRPGNAAQEEEEEETSDEEAVSEDGATSDKAGRERSGAAGEGDDEDDDDDEDERHASRVVYFKDLPPSHCNPADFVGLANGLGTPLRYHLMRHLQKGFLEMSRSREAVRVVNQLSVSFQNTPTVVLISNKYRRLPNGSAVPRDESGERRRRRRRNSRGERRSLEAASQGGKSAEVKPEGGETPQAKETPSEGGHTLQDQSKARKRRKEESESQRGNSLQRESKSRKTGERHSEAAKAAAAADDTLFSKASQRASAEDPAGSDSDTSAETLERRASPEDARVRGKIRNEEQRSQTSAETDSEQEARGTSGTPATPLRPVGTEFVRPVVGYFCSLCQAGQEWL